MGNNGRLWYRAILLLAAVLLLVYALTIKVGDDISAFYHPEAYVRVSRVRVWLPAAAGVLLAAEGIFTVLLSRRSRGRRSV